MNIRNKLCTYRMEMGTFLEDTRTLQNLLQQTDNDTITFSRKYIWNWNVQKKKIHMYLSCFTSGRITDVSIFLLLCFHSNIIINSIIVIDFHQLDPPPSIFQTAGSAYVGQSNYTNKNGFLMWIDKLQNFKLQRVSSTGKSFKLYVTGKI